MVTNCELEREAFKQKKFVVDILDYPSFSSRIKGFQAIREMGLQGPNPMLVLTNRAFEEYKRSGMSSELQQAIEEAFCTIRQENPQRGGYIGRAFYVPRIDNPNGPRTASIRDEEEYVKEVKRFWDFVLENGYGIQGSDIALILHPFIHVMDPPRGRYAEIKLSEDETLPHSGGYAFSAPLPSLPNRIEVRALFGADEAVQSCSHDTFFVDPDSETILEKGISYKVKTLIPKTGSDYVMVEIPRRFRSMQSLTDLELLLLARQMRGKRGIRSEFIVQEDGIFFREIAPYDQQDEYKLFHLDEGETVTGPIIEINSQKDVSKIRGANPIVYLGPEAFLERRTDLFAQVANCQKETIFALVHGTVQTSHMARILADQGHNVILVGDKEFREGEWVNISLGKDELPELERVNSYTNSVVDLKEVQKLIHGEAGKKVARLAVMLDAGINVPPGFAITSEALWEHLKYIGVFPDIQRLDSVDLSDTDALAELSLRIQERIVTAQFHNDFESLIEEAVVSSGLGSFAVRSSGDEDGRDQSMAGLFDSHLDVKPGQINQKVLETVASYFSPAAVVAIRSAGRQPSKITVGVGIHEFISVDSSDPYEAGGTVFTYPDQIIIEAVFGSPGLIVSGEANNFSRVTVNREGSLSRVEKFGNKLACPNLENGVDDGDVVQKLLSAARQIETIFSDYQDLEWIRDKKHGLVILQSRPL